MFFRTPKSDSASRKQSTPQSLGRISWQTKLLEPRIMLAADAGVAAEVATAVADTPACEVVNVKTTLAQSIVFVDSDLNDADVLLDGLANDSEIVLLDASRDAIDQISSVLSDRSNVDQVHIVTHGQSGAVLLGNQLIDGKTLAARSRQISVWSDALTADADILLYGCNTGQGRAGAQFVAGLAKLTSADVAASTNLTGDRSQGGDWDFEIKSGEVESFVAFDVVARNRFQNTLNITVNAWGDTGEEQFDLLIDGGVVQSWTADTTWQPFEYVTDESITADRVAIRFKNDLYQPENGIDRNLTVDNIVIDGNLYETESPTTFSTGTWLPDDGVADGYGRGQVLHANGVFEYLSGANEPLVWGGADWTNNDPNDLVYVDPSRNELVLPSGDETSVWRVADVQAGGVYKFSVDAVVNFYASDAGQQAPYASVGIDFRNAEGVEIGELIIDTNTSDASSPAVDREFVAPKGTAFATIWAWQGEAPSDSLSELRLQQVSLERIDLSGDTTPPTAELNPNNPPLVFNNANDSLSFIVKYNDDQRLGSPASIRVTGPNGYDQIAVAFTGGGNGVTEITTLHGIFPEVAGTPTRDWSTQDNGEYTVILEPNSLTDQAGNVAPGQVLGTFLVSIGDETDTIPPTARLATTTAQINEIGEVQFGLVYQDNIERVSFANDGQPTVTVTGPNGYQQSFSGFAGGIGSGINEMVEFFVLPPGPNGYVAGEYFVSLNEGRILDESGNAAPAGLLGSFQLLAG
ncbi:DUF4347 domain-containing protein [Planctomycetes bacterium K23_9]|uniref:DUF4347 domain-containing protein n=1 Tax=Stieleria marina TaxID=1930275 RepID=A0A517NP51_9BACT|nr:hypothetical protein K239x_08410 [Planctomycetes bacterium K23_9]